MTSAVWDRVAGSPATQRIADAVASGDIAHAWLLLGPAGWGKQETAVAMAAAMNCTKKPGTGCGECTTCLRIVRRRHPDVHHIVPEGPLISVDVVRELVVPEAARSPFEAAHKAFVFEEADRMNEAAQNALLKTLEEPQPDTVFVLISDREEELLETIRSRCRIVRLEPIPESRMVELLRVQGAGEKDALLAARVSEGDLDHALKVVMDPATRSRRELWTGIPGRLMSPIDALDGAAEILGEAGEAVAARAAAHKVEIAELAETMGLGRGTAAARNALAKRHRRELRRLEEEVLGEALTSIASFYRDVLMMRAGAEEGVSNLDLLDELDHWAVADEIQDSSLLRAVERCLEARIALTRNANQTLTIEAALLELSMIVPAPRRVASKP